MKNTLFNLCLLMNALSAEVVGEVKEISRNLRKEGFKVPSMNHKVLNLPYHAPFKSNVEGSIFSPAWIRASFMKHRQVEWTQGLRTPCSCGAWFAKGEVTCRTCGERRWFSGLTPALRDGESKLYEQKITGGIMGLRLIKVVRGVKSDWDARFTILKPRKQKGNLRNGNNQDTWTYPLGRSAHKVARALDRLGLTEEAEKYWAMPYNAQVWRQCVFVDSVHEIHNDSLEDFAVDVAFIGMLDEAGLKYRLTPNL